MAVIYRQEIIQDITFFTSAPKVQFYDKLFINLDLSEFPESTTKTGRNGFSKKALLCAFIVMKCECFSCITDSCITDLVDYLNNNLIIAHYCGFNIMKPLPSYWTFDRFIRKLDNNLLKKLMQSQVLKLSEIDVIDTSFIALDSTPVSANAHQNNSKSFAKNKFSKNNQPKSDKDRGLGVHTASNQHNERKFEYYWGYKNHILVDCITGLPIYELTTTADVADSTVTLDILSQTNSFLSVDECTFLADKGYDVKAVYNTVKELYHGECIIPLNKRNAKNPKKLYALRTEAERYNSCFKQTGQERLWVHGFNAAQNLNSVAHIALLAVALASVVTKSDCSYRCLKFLKRIA